MFKKVRLITICAWCKNTQNADGSSGHTENDPQTDAETAVSHGICLECAEKSYNEYRLATFPTLFGQMRLALNEADAITGTAGILIRASKPSEHFDEWRQIRERWENARQKWLAAAESLKNHLATTPGYARP